MSNRGNTAGRAAKLQSKFFKEGTISLAPLYIKDGHIGIFPSGEESPIGTYALQLDVNAEDNSGSAIANSWIAYSSIKHKQDVEEIEDALEKVLQLRGVNFTWIKSKKEDIGLIAEEVSEVIPRAVEYDESDGITPIGLDYTRLVPYLIECVKEQQDRILDLEKKVSEMSQEK